MRLGGPVFHWSTAEEWALEHVARGYGAAYWPLGLDASPEKEQAFVDAAHRHDLVIAEVGVWNHLFHPDPETAENNVRVCIERMKQADRVGARCCVNVSGSCGPDWDGAHRDNLTKETFDRIVRLTQRMLDEAQLKNTFYTLEPMPWMYPTDAEDAKALLAAIDRPSFAVHVDMVNMIDTPKKIYKTGELTRHFFAELNEHIRSVHVKDIGITTGLTIDMPEVLCGTGEFDHAALLTECAKLDDVPVMVEHLKTEEEYDQAVAHLRKVAAECGLAFDSAK